MFQEKTASVKGCWSAAEGDEIRGELGQMQIW